MENPEDRIPKTDAKIKEMVGFDIRKHSAQNTLYQN